MMKPKIAAGITAALLAGLGLLASSGLAAPLAAASGCKIGKETQGCRLTFGGYRTLDASVFVGFPAANASKGSRTTLTVSSSFVCHTAFVTQLSVKTKQTAKVGDTISFSGKAALLSAGAGAPEVSAAKINAQLKLNNAKQAHLTGRVEMTLATGAKCSKALPGKLVRVLGG